jgi:hypothetical protein
MMDWTDRHCRYFHRLLTRRTLLYTEMVTTGALLHGDVPRHLQYNPEEQPPALQLGGSEPADCGARWRRDRLVGVLPQVASVTWSAGIVGLKACEAPWFAGNKR